MIPIGLIGSGGSGIDVGAPIANSGAFDLNTNSDLSRTFTAVGGTSWSVSFWVKRANVGVQHRLFNAFATNSDGIQFSVDDEFELVRSGVVASTSAGFYRDPAAWYHIFCRSNGTNVKGYVNGIEECSYTGTFTKINDNIIHSIGEDGNGAKHHQGYISDVYFVSDAALTVDDFGYFSPSTGEWVAKSYSGTYGTNGFYLDFSNGANLGEDQSGNNNDFTNTAVTQSTDTPNNSACIISHNTMYDTGITKNAGRTYVNASTNLYNALTSFDLLDGIGWYWEVDLVTRYVYHPVAGIFSREYNHRTNTTTYGYTGCNNVTVKADTGGIYKNGVLVTTLPGYASGDIVMLAYKDGKFWVGKNGTWSGNPSAGTGEATTANVDIYGYTPSVAESSNSDNLCNFHEDDLVYSPPTGFVALSTVNLPEPEIIDPSKYFKTIIYDDGAGAKTVGFQPDFVWLKARGALSPHKHVDSARGATYAFDGDDTNGSTLESTGLTSFDANGFTVGADTNYSNTTGTGMVAWCFKKKAGFFDIIRYTADNTGDRLIPHNLGVVPEMYWIRNESITTNGTSVFFTGLDGSLDRMYMSDSTVKTDYTLTILPTSTNITVDTTFNDNSEDFTLYAFASVEGFCKVGTYIGNGNVNGPFIYCGFRPAFVLFKRATSPGAWYMYDTTRDIHNPVEQYLLADSTAIETTSSIRIVDFVSNGFKIRGSSTELNGNDSTYVYLAIAESPFKYARAR